MKFNHVGIPATGSFDGEIPLPHLTDPLAPRIRPPMTGPIRGATDGAVARRALPGHI